MTKLVGILNITPDSFSDGGAYLEPAAAIAAARRLFEAGAALVDVGAESTRPHATPLTDQHEWARLEPILRPLLKQYPGRISLDSYHSATVRWAFELGPVIINDVTGFNDLRMQSTAANLRATVIISHLPAMTLQDAHRLAPVTTVDQVRTDLLHKAAVLESMGLRPDQIILDPGIGFGKTMELNARLLTFAREVPAYQVMIGYSRKRFLGEHRLEQAPNLEAGRIAIAAGAAYLRVHDVVGHAALLVGVPQK